MSFEKLDNDEILHLILDYINEGNHADVLTMIKVMLDRDPGHAFATYLLAAEYAQLGMMDRAENAFKSAVDLVPDFPMARFQLGQLYLVKNKAGDAKDVLTPLTLFPDGQAITNYSKALVAVANNELEAAVSHLEAGLECDQEIPALTVDMRAMLNNLRLFSADVDSKPSISAAAPLYLSNYGKAGN